MKAKGPAQDTGPIMAMHQARHIWPMVATGPVRDTRLTLAMGPQIQWDQLEKLDI